MPASPASIGNPPELAELEEKPWPAISEIRRSPGPAGAADSWLNEEEVSALESAGLRLAPSDGPTTDPVAEGAAQSAALWATALRVADAAQRLRVAPSRVRQRLGERSLYGMKRSGEWRLPEFQFAGDSLVEGIDHVLRELPGDMHPVAVWNWFRFPKPELETKAGQELSPLDWLRGGQPWAPVAELVRDAGSTP